MEIPRRRRASVTQERGKARGGGGAMEKWSWGSEERETERASLWA
jgi:hypothetical protein